jgi:hypothetical protein
VHLFIDHSIDFPRLAKSLTGMLTIGIDLQGYDCRWETVEFCDEKGFTIYNSQSVSRIFQHFHK